MKKFLFAMLVLAMFPSLTVAQSTSDADVDPSGASVASCATLTVNMRYRMRDTQTNGGVSSLQDFLNTKGYLSSEPTGFFGIATLKAVKDYQASISLSPTGHVGPLTRAKINASCGGGETTTITSSGNFAAGCTSASGYSLTTGKSCSPATSTTNKDATSCVTVGNTTTCTTTAPSPTIEPTNLPPGCKAALGYSTTTGLSCSPSKVVPTVTLVANGHTATAKDSVVIPYNTSETLSWSSHEATSCSLSASPSTSSWSGAVPLSGYKSTGDLTESRSYLVQCSNSYGTGSARLDVRVESATVSNSCVTTSDTTTCHTTPVGSPEVIVYSSTQPTPKDVYSGNAQVPFTKITLTSNTETITINGITVQWTGQGDSGIFSSVVLLDENGTQYGPAATFDSSNQAIVGGTFSLGLQKMKTFTVAGNMAPSLNAYANYRVGVPIVKVNTTAKVTGAPLPILGATHIAKGTYCSTVNNVTTCSTNPPPVASPKVTLTINGNGVETSQLAGSSLSFVWTSNDVTNCIPQGSWDGSIGTSGSRTVILPATSLGQYAYFIRCTATNGSFVYSPTVRVNVTSVAPVTAPHITSVVSELGDYVIKGTGFHATSNSVTINGVTLVLPAFNSTDILFNPSSFGITSSGNYVVKVSHPTEGMSNSISANISICTTEGSVTTCL